MSTRGGIRAGKAYVELYGDDSKLTRTLQTSSAKLQAWGDNVSGIGRQIATVSAMALLPLALSTRIFADLDDQMRAVKAVTGATADEFERLYETAKLLGRTTSFTASQVAGGQLGLGRAGFKPEEIQASIRHVLNLARATGTDLAEATDIAAGTMRAFRLESSQMERVADIMVATANNSAQTLTDLGESMKYAAPIAEAYGVSLEDTAKSLGILANVQIKGSMAGTSFRMILLKLSDPAVRTRLKSLDVDLSTIENTLTGMGIAMERMTRPERLGFAKEFFGARAAAAVVKLAGAHFPDLADAIDFANETAARTATEMDSGIGGVIRRLMSAVEGASNAFAQALAPALSNLGETLTDALGGITTWIERNQELVTGIVKVGAAVLAFGATLWVIGTASKLIGVLGIALAFLAANPIVAATIAAVALGFAMSKMSEASAWATRAILAISAAFAIALGWNPYIIMLVGIAAVVVELSKAFNEASVSAAKFSDEAQKALIEGDRQRTIATAKMKQLEELAAKEKLNNVEMEKARRLIESLTATYGDLGIAINQTTGEITGLMKAQQEMTAKMAEAAKAEVEADLAALGAEKAELLRQRKTSLWREDVMSPLGTMAKARKKRLSEEIFVLGMRETAAKARLKAIEAVEEVGLTGAEPGEGPSAEAEAADEAVKDEEERARKTINLWHRQSQILLGMIDDRHKREIDQINERYDHEVLQAELAGKEIATINDTRDLKLKATRKRQAEEDAEEAKRKADTNAKEAKRQADTIADYEKTLRHEIDRLEIEKNLEGQARAKALRELERDRAMAEAMALGINLDLVRQKFDLQDIVGEGKERFTTVGTFSAIAAARMGGGGGIAERNVKANEAALKKLDQIQQELARGEKLQFVA